MPDNSWLRLGRQPSGDGFTHHTHGPQHIRSKGGKATLPTTADRPLQLWGPVHSKIKFVFWYVISLCVCSASNLVYDQFIGSFCLFCLFFFSEKIFSLLIQIWRLAWKATPWRPINSWWCSLAIYSNFPYAFTAYFFLLLTVVEFWPGLACPLSF